MEKRKGVRKTPLVARLSRDLTARRLWLSMNMPVLPCREDGAGRFGHQPSSRWRTGCPRPPEISPRPCNTLPSIASSVGLSSISRGRARQVMSRNAPDCPDTELARPRRSRQGPSDFRERLSTRQDRGATRPHGRGASASRHNLTYLAGSPISVDEAGNGGYGQGSACGVPRQSSTLLLGETVETPACADTADRSASFEARSGPPPYPTERWRASVELTAHFSWRGRRTGTNAFLNT